MSKNANDDAGLRAAWKAFENYSRFDEKYLGKDMNLFQQIGAAVSRLESTQEQNSETFKKIKLYHMLQSQVLQILTKKAHRI